MSANASVLRRLNARFPYPVMAGALTILSFSLVTPALAQGAPGYGYGPGGAGGYRSNGEHMGRPGGGRRMVSRETLDGPASPAIMRDSVSLRPDQLQQYSTRYATYMADTRSERDSLRTNVQAMRTAFENGDRSAARDRRDVIQRQAKDLASRDKKFDDGLKDILSKDQQKSYQKYKDSQDKQQRDRWRDRQNR